VLEIGVEQYQRTFDRRFGGFGDAPKFPRPSELLFLMREDARGRVKSDAGAGPALEMAVETLRAMAFGGMRDHVGGGFHRYSVDRGWRVPHFEKMLYDQAQLALAFLEAAQATGDDFHAVVAEDTLEYVRRDLTGPHGGFFSAEDADSVPPEHAGNPSARKSEGAFYLWTSDEIDALLGGDSEIVKLRFGITPGGNAPEDPQGEFTGKNILYTAAEIQAIASQTDRAADEIVDILGRARPTMFYSRARRPRPHLDDKVLTAWNGLMIAAFARAGRVLSTGRAPEYVETARNAARFIRQTLWDDSRHVLLRRYRDDHAAIDGYCEDYAYLVFGLLELFQADGDAAWLEWALKLQARQNELFADPSGGWFSTSGDDPAVLLRLKEVYDGAEPAAGSIGVMNLLAFAHLTADQDHLQRAERALAQLSDRGQEPAKVAPFMCAALATYYAGMEQIVLAGDPERSDTRALRNVLASTYLPFSIVIPLREGGDGSAARVLPFTAGMGERDGRATAYVCHDFRCEAPLHDPDDLRALAGSRA
jgi:hypothetical protein